MGVILGVARARVGGLWRGDGFEIWHVTKAERDRRAAVHTAITTLITSLDFDAAIASTP